MQTVFKDGVLYGKPETKEEVELIINLSKDAPEKKEPVFEEVKGKKPELPPLMISAKPAPEKKTLIKRKSLVYPRGKKKTTHKYGEN